MGTRRRRGSVLATLAACLFLAPALSAHADDTSDHDRARRALEAGEILPLNAVLENVSRDAPGRVLDVELEHANGRWVYEVRVLRSGGVLIKLLVDARDGRVITRRGEGPHENH